MNLPAPNALVTAAHAYIKTMSPTVEYFESQETLTRAEVRTLSAVKERMQTAELVIAQHS